MARYARQRGMFFGSWDGNSITANCAFSVGDSTGITGASLVESTGMSSFSGKATGGAGEYVFNYDGQNWLYNGIAQNLTEWGITVTGTPAENDIIVVDYTATAGGWEALGKDNDDLTKDLNPDTESSKNVLGESTFRHSGVESSINLDPYYIDPSRKMYKHLREVAIEEKFGESDLLGLFAEAFFTWANDKTKKMGGYCYVRQAWYVPQSTGGDTTAYAIPVEIHPIGASTKKKIVYDMTTNEATITDIEST